MKPKLQLQLPLENELTVIQYGYYVEIRQEDFKGKVSFIRISYDRFDMLLKCLRKIEKQRKNSAKKQEEQA